jgi:hypothetical protein
MTALAPNSHKRLNAVRRQYAKTATQQVAIIGIGDSRSAYTRFRVQSQISRLYDAQIASIFVTAEETSSAQMWKDGFALSPVTLTGVTQTGAFPGDTFASTGIVNTFPIALREFWSASGAAGASTGRCFLIYLTHGGQMNSSATDGSTGGNARRGSPYGTTKGIDSITVFRATDTRSVSVWTTMFMEAGQSTDNNNESSIGASGNFAPVLSPSGVTISPDTWTLPANTITAGNGVTMRYRFTADPGGGQGFVLAGVRFRFRNNGYTYYPVAVGGWSTADHLTNPVDGITNTDTKYTDEGIREFLRKIATETNIVLRVELGQNSNASGNPLEEWSGINGGAFGDNIRRILRRWTNILREPEFASRSVVVELIPHWYTVGDRPRAVAYRDLLSTVADQFTTDAIPVALYDQIAELEARYTATAGVEGLDNSVGLMPANAGDPVHQNYARVLVLGDSEWDAVYSTTQTVGSFREPSASMPGSIAFSITPNDSNDLAYLTTQIVAMGAGAIAVTTAEGQNVTLAAVPAGRPVYIRASRVLSTGTTATNIVGMT